MCAQEDQAMWKYCMLSWTIPRNISKNWFDFSFPSTTLLWKADRGMIEAFNIHRGSSVGTTNNMKLQKRFERSCKAPLISESSPYSVQGQSRQGSAIWRSLLQQEQSIRTIWRKTQPDIATIDFECNSGTNSNSWKNRCRMTSREMHIFPCS